MKVFCKSCGCHFPQDFEETQSKDCTFWTERDFPDSFVIEHEEWARKIWDHQFALNLDALAIETDLVYVEGPFHCSKKPFGENQWAESVPGYADWEDDKDRRDLQKAYFKFTKNDWDGIGQAVFQVFCAMWVKKKNLIGGDINRDEIGHYLEKILYGAANHIGGDEWKEFQNKRREGAGMERIIDIGE